jgi:hypothetical protein
MTVMLMDHRKLLDETLLLLIQLPCFKLVKMVQNTETKICPVLLKQQVVLSFDFLVVPASFPLLPSLFRILLLHQHLMH